MNDKELSYQGTIISISPIQNVSDKFRKQEFVLCDETAEYKQYIQFEFHKDKCDKLVNYKVGDLVNVSYNLNGRQWTDPKSGQVKTFNTLSAWRIASVAPSGQGDSSEPLHGGTASDDLPF